MRLDQFLSDMGIIKRRTVAKEMADSGLIKIGGLKAKPAHTVKAGDIISIGGGHPITVEVLKIPVGNVRKDQRGEYFKTLA
jgi:ribosomal 50S subunit-recycling heat shock protein